MRRLVALALALPAAACAAPAPAKTPAPAAPTEAAAPSSDSPAAILAALARVRRAVRVGRSRPPVAPRTFRVADLPREPSVVRRTQGDLVVSRVVADAGGERLALLGVRGALFGQVHYRDTVGFVGRPFAENAGAAVRCGAGHGDWAFWEGLRADPDGGATWIAGEGWFEPGSCSARAIRVGASRAAPLVPDSVFAFVACAASCEEEARLVVLVPEASTLATSNAVKTPGGPRAVARIELALGGRGAWVAVRVKRGTLADFHAGIRAREAPRPADLDDAPEPIVDGSDLFVVEALAATRPLDAQVLAHVIPLAENGSPLAPGAP